MGIAGPDIDTRRAHRFEARLHGGQHGLLEFERRHSPCNLAADLAAGQQLCEPFQIGRAGHTHEGIDDHLIAGGGIALHHIKQRFKLRIVGQQ